MKLFNVFRILYHLTFLYFKKFCLPIARGLVRNLNFLHVEQKLKVANDLIKVI